LQIREKDLDVAAYLRLAAAIRSAVGEEPVPPHAMRILCNGRLDVTLASGAEGVHLTSTGPPVHRVRRAVGRGVRIGVSTHSVAAIRSAVDGGADYVVFGPVYETPSKRGMGEPQGIAALRAAVEAASPVPLLAIGGIDAGRARQCRGAGAHGVGMIRGVLAAPDPEEAARAIQRALRGEGR
ncbi:MAG: thiamine phosphate synthase, partial [Acidobacteriota bacterium]